MAKLMLLVPLFASSVCLAQFDASVLGTVTDPASATVAGSKVKLDNLRTGVSESAVTDSNGIYRFLNVPIGQYPVIAQAPGFKTVTAEEFTVTVEARQRVDIRLEIGEISASVTVSGANHPAGSGTRPSQPRCRPKRRHSDAAWFALQIADEVSDLGRAPNRGARLPPNQWPFRSGIPSKLQRRDELITGTGATRHAIVFPQSSECLDQDLNI